MRVPYFYYFQAIALIACIIFYRDLKKYRLQYFLPLCILVAITELLASNFKKLGLPSNYPFQNLYLIFSTPLYFYIFYKILNIGKDFRKIYIAIGISVSLLFFGNYLFFEGPMRLNTLTIIFQQMVTILLSCSVLFHLATNEKHFLLLREPYFWIASALMIFSLGALVVMGMNQYIRLNNLTIKNKALYRVIMPVLNVILYSSYTYAFYLCKPKKKLYSPS